LIEEVVELLRQSRLVEAEENLEEIQFTYSVVAVCVKDIEG